MTTSTDKTIAKTAAGSPADEALYGAVEMRLTLRQWAVVALLVAAVLTLLPLAARWALPADRPPDDRIPYSQSSDYWVFEQFSRQAAQQGKTLVLGDSVVWGEYVPPDGTLSHYLNARSDKKQYANLGVDGMYPVALLGLFQHHGGAISNRRVILQCNPLWLASPEHNLRAGKEFRFNHPSLLPQFTRDFWKRQLSYRTPWNMILHPDWPPQNLMDIFPPAGKHSLQIPAYKASLDSRLEIVAERLMPFRPWVRHWRNENLDNLDLQSWTLDHPYSTPARKDPTADSPSATDSHGGENGQAAKDLTWSQRGIGVQDFPWEDLDDSPQWLAFRRAVECLRHRGNTVFVVIGPFNEHMLTPGSRARYRTLLAKIESSLRDSGVPCLAPPVLPSDCYADASHPLAKGYEILAKDISECSH